MRKQQSQLAGCVERTKTLQETVACHSAKIKDIKITQEDLLDAKTTDGVFLWKISDLERRCKDAVEQRTISIYSPPFQTHPCGYQLCIQAYLNGDGAARGTHLSVFLVVMRSEFDKFLQWPFSCRVTFTLLNQVSQFESISESFCPDVESSSPIGQSLA